jgi:hypothetical protein
MQFSLTIGIIGFVLIFLMISVTKWLAGLWNCFLTLIVTILSGLVSCSLGNTVANNVYWAAGPENDMRFLAGLAGYWILFLLTFVLLRIAVETASKTKLKFDPITDIAGRTVLSLAIAVVFLSYSLYTFHLAPLPDSGQWVAGSNSPMGIGLDRYWGQFVQHASWNSMRENDTLARLVSKRYPIFRGADGTRYYEVVAGDRERDRSYRRISIDGNVYVGRQMTYDMYVRELAQFRRDVAAYNQRAPSEEAAEVIPPF